MIIKRVSLAICMALSIGTAGAQDKVPSKKLVDYCDQMVTERYQEAAGLRDRAPDDQKVTTRFIERIYQNDPANLEVMEVALKSVYNSDPPISREDYKKLATEKCMGTLHDKDVAKIEAQRDYAPSADLVQYCDAITDLYQEVAGLRNRGLDESQATQFMERKYKDQAPALDFMQPALKSVYNAYPRISLDGYKTFANTMCLADYRDKDAQLQADERKTGKQ